MMTTTKWIIGLILAASASEVFASTTISITSEKSASAVNKEGASFAIRTVKQDTTFNRKYHKPVHKIGFDISSAYVFPTDGFFKGENNKGTPIRHHLSAHLKYGFKFASDTYFGKLYPHATQGIGVAYNTFFNQHELGTPWSVYVFQNSRLFTINRTLSLDYEWNFGASFGWKEYNEDTNNMNDIVGSKINAYINLGLMLNWNFAPQWNMTAGLGITHYSNGNTSYPNFGVNTIGGRIGVVRTIGSDDANESRLRNRERKLFRPYISYDLVLYGSARKKGIYFDEDENGTLVPGKFAILGLNFSPMYNINQYFRTGVSLDIQYDESANITKYVVNKGAASEEDRKSVV